MALGPLNNSNDTPIGGDNYRSWVNPLPTPNDGDILIYRTATGTWDSEPTPSIDASSLVRAGYGEVKLSAPQFIGTVNATPFRLPADSTDVPNPVNVTENLANDSLAMELDGVWQFSVVVDFTFDSSNNTGRKLTIELYNQTAATTKKSINVGVGRDGSVATFGGAAIFDVALAEISDEFVVRVYSTTDTFTNASLDNFNFSLVHVSY